MTRIQPRTTEVSGITMDWITFGNGKRNLVIIPGLSLRSVLPMADFIASQYRILTEDYTVYLFERKRNIPKEYGFPEIADDTVAVMKAVGIESADFYGVSMGGMILQNIALRHPEIVNSMILASTLSKPNKIGEDSFYTWRRLADEGNVKALTHDMLKRVYSPKYYEEYKDVFEKLENDPLDAIDLERFKILANSCSHADTYERLGEIKCPIFVTGGENDDVLGFIGSEEIAEKTGAGLYMYKNGGHACYDEEPDHVARMLEFYRSIRK